MDMENREEIQEIINICREFNDWKNKMGLYWEDILGLVIQSVVIEI